MWLALLLALFPAVIASALAANADPNVVVVVGLIAFGVVFALNSAVHSFLILALRGRRPGGDERRLLLHGERRPGGSPGTCCPGLLYQWQGLEACLWASVVFVSAPQC